MKVAQFIFSVLLAVSMIQHVRSTACAEWKTQTTCGTDETCVWTTNSNEAGVCKCKSTNSNFVFVIDGSGSIGPPRFETQRKFMNDLLTTSIPVGSGVGIVQFSSPNRVTKRISITENLSAVSQVLLEMPYLGGSTAMGNGIQLGLDMLRDEGTQGRSKFLFLVTDGKPNRGINPCDMASRIESTVGLTVLILGIGGGFSKSKVICLLQNRAPNQDRYIIIADSYDPAVLKARLPAINARFCPRTCLPALQFSKLWTVGGTSPPQKPTLLACRTAAGQERVLCEYNADKPAGGCINAGSDLALGAQIITINATGTQMDHFLTQAGICGGCSSNLGSIAGIMTVTTTFSPVGGSGTAPAVVKTKTFSTNTGRVEIESWAIDSPLGFYIDTVELKIEKPLTGPGSPSMLTWFGPHLCSDNVDYNPQLVVFQAREADQSLSYLYCDQVEVAAQPGATRRQGCYLDKSHYTTFRRRPSFKNVAAYVDPTTDTYAYEFGLKTGVFLTVSPGDCFPGGDPVVMLATVDGTDPFYDLASVRHASCMENGVVVVPTRRDLKGPICKYEFDGLPAKTMVAPVDAYVRTTDRPDTGGCGLFGSTCDFRILAAPVKPIPVEALTTTQICVCDTTIMRNRFLRPGQTRHPTRKPTPKPTRARRRPKPRPRPSPKRRRRRYRRRIRKRRRRKRWGRSKRRRRYRRRRYRRRRNRRRYHAKKCGPKNVALGQRTGQISTGWKGVSGRAVDGKTDGNYWHHSCTHTKLNRQPWWYVNIGIQNPVCAVRIFNRRDCCARRLRYFSVFVTNRQPVPGRRFIPKRREICKFVNSHAVLRRKTFRCYRPMKGKFVGISLRGRAYRYLTLCEVQVFTT